MQLGGNFSIFNNFIYLKVFAILLSSLNHALYSIFQQQETLQKKRKKLQSKLQVWLPPLALQASDKSSFHCVKWIQSAEQYKLAG